MKFKQVIISAAMLTVGSGVQAQWYGELTYTSAKTHNVDGAFTTDTKPRLVGFYVGHGLHENLAVEGTFSTGVNSGSEVILNGASMNPPMNSKAVAQYGAFLKPRVKLSEKVELFARFGYLTNKSENAQGNAVTHNTRAGHSYGVGASYAFDNTTYISASWMSFHDKGPLTFDGWMLGIGRKF